MIWISKSMLMSVNRTNLSVISPIPWKHAIATQQIRRYHCYYYIRLRQVRPML
jgi:hypothetical protein